MEDDKINHDKFILLVGAGASRDIGYPTLDDLLKQAMIGFDDIDQLIRATNSAITVNGPKSTNYEQLIGKLKEYSKLSYDLRTDYVLMTVFKQIPNVLEIESKFAQALIKCYRILANLFGPDGVNKNSGAFTFLPDFYKKLAELNTTPSSSSRAHSLHIYTTNYDCSYQVMASNFNNISFMTHISNEDGKFKDGWYNIRVDLTDKGLPEVYIHRLHGCVTWYNIPGDDGSPGNTREKIGSGGGHTKLIYKDNELQNMCIKLNTTELLGKHKIFSGAFEEFYQQLNDIDVLIVWGYSFSDFEVTSQINQALMVRRANPFRIYYIDPYLSDYAVFENIVNTLSKATIKVSPHFRPQQIKWIPSDGRDTLTQMVIERITNI